MEWLARMNMALDYIEDNLCSEIDFGTLEKIACCSAHTFFKMFSYAESLNVLAMYCKYKDICNDCAEWCKLK